MSPSFLIPQRGSALADFLKLIFEVTEFLGAQFREYFLHLPGIYQGSGTTGSRIRHAMFSAFVAKGHNGRWQPNYSSLGGNLASSALSNFYYPQSNRGVGLVFGNFAIGTAERIGASLSQEFLLGKFTRRGRHIK